MFNLRSINKVRSQTPCDPPVTYIKDTMSIHYFDRVMSNVSIRLAQDLMVDWLIWKMRLSMTKKRYAKIINKRNHSVTR